MGFEHREMIGEDRAVGRTLIGRLRAPSGQARQGAGNEREADGSA